MQTPFNENIEYRGPVELGTVVSANLLNAMFWQRGVFADRPGAGNRGVVYVSTDGADGLGGSRAAYYDTGGSWDLMNLA